MFGIFSTISDIWSFVIDHRFAALAGLAMAGAAAVWSYLPIAGRPLAKGLVVVAIGLGCFDGGYSLRARQDRTADLRAELAVSRALVAKKDAEAESAARIADGLRITRLQEEARGDAMDKTVQDFDTKEPPNAATPAIPAIATQWRTVFRRAPAPTCVDGDPGLGRDFTRSLQRLNREAGRGGAHRR